MKYAYFAGGCFWCVTPVFLAVNGVNEVICGYSGGKEENPTYLQVKHQETGHRETIRIEYDENIVSFRKLLGVFLKNVDPFDGEGQYIDRGFSYTLAVYANNPDEIRQTEGALSELAEKSGKEPKVSVEEFSVFYTAEEYHQHYFEKNPAEFEKELLESGRKK